MKLKKIALITMCASLALMVILLAAVLIELGPIIALFFGMSKPTPPAPTEPSTPPTTVATQPTVPTTQPAEPTEPPTEPTKPVTEPPTEPTKPVTEPTEPSVPATKPTEPPHVHSFKQTEYVEVTCETSGYELYTCTGCGIVEMRNLTNALGHAYGPGEQINPTCTEGGCIRFTCELCGKTEERDPTDALGHDYELIEEVEVSCTADGYKEYKCTRCENVMRDDVVKSTGHAFGEWEFSVEPAEGVVGEMTRACENCDEVETKACELTFRREHADDAGVRIYFAAMVTKNSAGEEVAVYSYTVRDQSFAGDMVLTPIENGLLNVEYSDPSGAHRSYTIYPGDTLEIDKNGIIVTHSKPEPSEPTEPVQPTEPVTEPTEPTEPVTESTEPITEPTDPTETSEPGEPAQTPEA